MAVDAQSFGDGIRCFASGRSLGYLLAKLDPEPGAADPDPLGFRSDHAGFGPVADLLCLDLCQGRKQRQQDIAHQLVVRREVRLGIGMEGGRPQGVRVGRTAS